MKEDTRKQLQGNGCSFAFSFWASSRPLAMTPALPDFVNFHVWCVLIYALWVCVCRSCLRRLAVASHICVIRLLGCHTCHSSYAYLQTRAYRKKWHLCFGEGLEVDLGQLPFNLPIRGDKAPKRRRSRPGPVSDRCPEPVALPGGSTAWRDGSSARAGF